MLADYEVNDDELYDGDANRGSIKYEKRYKQLISYEGLIRTGKVTPTDIDGFIDYNGKAFLFIEAKLKGALFSYGQRLAYQNLIEVLKRGGAFVWCVVFEHNIPPHEKIIAKYQTVDEIYSTDGHGWQKPSNHYMTVGDAVEEFERICIEKGLNIYLYPKKEE